MDQGTFQRVLRRAVLVPFALAAFVALALFLEVRTLTKQGQWVDHTDQVIVVAQRIYRLQVDEETGLRAYVLTQDERFLQPFRAGRKEALDLQQQLASLISDNPEQQASNANALQLGRDWDSFADDAISRTKAGQDASRVEFQLHGKELMDRYRHAREAFIEREVQLRQEREARSMRTSRLVTTTIATLCLLLGLVSAGMGRTQLRNLSQAYDLALDEARKQAKEARSQKQRFETTLRSIGDAVIATDDGGKITFMNTVAEHLTGWNLHEAQNADLPEVFRIVNEQTRATVENPVDKVRRLDRVVGLANHTLLISKTGAEHAIDDSGAPIRDESGAIAGIVLVFRDITQKKTLEAALRSNERLAVAGRLAASIAHEIHNPLDGVGNLLFMLRERAASDADTLTLVNMAQHQLHRVTQISKNMLTLSRESRVTAPIHVSQVLDEVVSLIEDTIAKGKRQIQVDHGFDGTVEGNAVEFRQVFTNVIKNAVEATSEGGHIRITSAPNQEGGRPGVMIQVSDDGPGIPEQIRTSLFTPFATTKQDGGTGLGLWVSRSILEKQGGSIRVSNEGTGTTVSIFIPNTPGAVDPQGTATSMEA